MNKKSSKTRSGASPFNQLRKLVRSRFGDATRESIGALIACLRVNRPVTGTGASPGTRNHALLPELISANSPDSWVNETAGRLVGNLSGRIQAAQRELDFLVAERVQCMRHNEPRCLDRLSPELATLAARMHAGLCELRPEHYRTYAERVCQLSPVRWQEDRFNPLGAEVLVYAFLSCIQDSLASASQREMLQPVLVGEVVASLYRVLEAGSDFMDRHGVTSSDGGSNIKFIADQETLADEHQLAGPVPASGDNRSGRSGRIKSSAALSAPVRATARSAIKMPERPKRKRAQSRPGGSMAARAARAARTINRLPLRGADELTLPANPAVLKSIEQIEQDAVAFAHRIDQVPYSRKSRQSFFQHVRQSMAEASCTPSQLATLDLVGAMFDYVVDDRRVPESVQPLLWRLQLPLLTIALLDPGYLSDERRSIRRLLENIGAISSRFGEQVARGSDAHRRLETSVRAIEIVSSGLSARSQTLAVQVGRAFERCSSGMSQLIDRIERDLGALEQTPGRTNRRDFSQRPGREEERQVTARLTSLISAKTRGLEIPTSVNVFLQSVWMRYMRTALLREGDTSPQFAAAERLIDELLWTLNEESGRGDRRELAQRIPQLIAQVNRGLHDVGAREEEHQAFFDELFLIHLRKLQRQRSAPEPAHSSRPSADGVADSSTVPVLTHPIRDSLGAEEKAGRASLNEAERMGITADESQGSTMPTSRLGPVSNTASRWASNDDDASEATTPVGGNKLLSMLQSIDLEDLPRSPSYHSKADSLDKTALQVGAWLEYRQSSGSITYLKVAWVNTQGTVALLVRNPDRRAMSKPTSQLRAYLASGRLRLLRTVRAA